MKKIPSDFVMESNEIFLAEEEKRNKERYERYVREKRKIERKRKLFINTAYQVHGFILHELLKREKITMKAFDSSEFKEMVNAVKNNLEKCNQVCFHKITGEFVDSAVEILKAEVFKKLETSTNNSNHHNWEEPEPEIDDFYNIEKPSYMMDENE